MTNGELFKKENPDIEVKINGSCVWIYYFDGVNHYTMPTEWWNKEIGVFEDIRAEIEKQIEADYAFAKCENITLPVHCGTANGLQVALKIIDRHMKEERS